MKTDSKVWKLNFQVLQLDNKITCNIPLASIL